LHWAEERKYVDKESFLVFAIALALFIVGTMGMVGSDDVLACFIAGNTFTWDDWFRLETMDDSFQPTIDMLLNVSIFIWFGAVCPWVEFVHNDVIPIYRLIPLGILVLLLRRPPIVFAMHTKIHQIEQPRQALYVGFFGPIGVSAIFYLYVSQEFLRKITVDGEIRPDAEYLMKVMDVVIWFLVICSVIIHGISIPLAKLGFYIPRTISQALTHDSDEPEPFHIREQVLDAERQMDGALRHRTVTPNQDSTNTSLPRRAYRIGRAIIRPRESMSTSQSRTHTPSGSRTPVPLSQLNVSGANSNRASPLASPTAQSSQDNIESASTPQLQPRTIKFPDEELPNGRTENGELKEKDH
jgi:hypothetical protein